MNFYLSSYHLGNELTKLKELISGTNGKFGYVSNALDLVGVDKDRADERARNDMAELAAQVAEVEILDLKEYFGKSAELKEKLASLGGVYVRGGNTFVLRQAMKLSGFDELLLAMKDRQDFLYIGYSAGVCVLTPTLRPYAITDDAKNFPYPEITEQIWEGLGIVPFVFQPHYKSDHEESASTDKEIEYCIENKILFKAYRDGEVLIIEN